MYVHPSRRICLQHLHGFGYAGSWPYMNEGVCVVLDAADGTACMSCFRAMPRHVRPQFRLEGFRDRLKSVRRAEHDVDVIADVGARHYVVPAGLDSSTFESWLTMTVQQKDLPGSHRLRNTVLARFREMWDTAGLPLKPAADPQIRTGAPCSHQRTWAENDGRSPPKPFVPDHVTCRSGDLRIPPLAKSAKDGAPDGCLRGQRKHSEEISICRLNFGNVF
jgi:hypothetical protein